MELSEKSILAFIKAKHKFDTNQDNIDEIAINLLETFRLDWPDTSIHDILELLETWEMPGDETQN